MELMHVISCSAPLLCQTTQTYCITNSDYRIVRDRDVTDGDVCLVCLLVGTLGFCCVNYCLEFQHIQVNLKYGVWRHIYCAMSIHYEWFKRPSKATRTSATGVANLNEHVPISTNTCSVAHTEQNRDDTVRQHVITVAVADVYAVFV